MENGLIVLTDLLRKPFDEGAKNTAYNIIKQLSQRPYVKTISVNGDENFGDSVKSIKNESFIEQAFLTEISNLTPNWILYISESSVTLFSVLRAKLLSLYTQKSECMFALQPRKYSKYSKLLVSALGPQKNITPSVFFTNYLTSIGISSSTIPLGVDDKKYQPFANKKRSTCRWFNIYLQKII